MTLGETIYAAGTRVAGLTLPFILDRRVATGKEDPARLHQRRAMNLPLRPEGQLVWLHGASVGESQVSLAVANELQRRLVGLNVLITSQTLTSADVIAARLNNRVVHQMAPLDTPAIARRFIHHWRPDLCVFVEGEIWPNLIKQAKLHGARITLVNGRMTKKSLASWARWSGTARSVFGKFDALLTADQQTASGLERLSGTAPLITGNIKQALGVETIDIAQVTALKNGWVDGEPVILAASTHDGEDELFLDAVAALPFEPKLIIAPRHPERADAIEALCISRGLSVSRRSRLDDLGKQDVLLADTIGEMALWYAASDTVFLGGASREGIGGHNPMEAVGFGHRIVTGPHGFNAREMFAPLEGAGVLQIASNSADIAAALSRHIVLPAPDHTAPKLAELSQNARRPLELTADHLERLLDSGRIS